MPIQIQKVVNAQRDFSGGQVDVELKRDDTSPVLKSGARVCSNLRILNSKNLTQRPGRSAKYRQPVIGRVDQVRLSSTVVADLSFNGDGSLTVFDITNNAILGNVVAGSYPWTSDTVDKIVWTLVNLDALNRDIVICFPGMAPQVVRYQPGLPCVFIPLPFLPSASGGISAPFYRLASGGVTLTPSAISGAITVISSSAVFVPAMVGTVIRWHGCQIGLNGYTSPTIMSGIVEQTLPNSYSVTGTSVTGFFTTGDQIQASASNVFGEVVSWNAGSGTLVVNMLNAGQPLVAGDTITGPTGKLVSPITTALIAPQASVQWDELVMGNYRGWPTSCFFDQGRLGLTGFPSVPRGIAWTAFNQFYNFLVGANPTDAMFELMSDTAQIYHVVVGDGGELIFTNIGVYYIPINEQNPLKPGSVVFKPISPEPSSAVHPIRIAEGVIYVSAGLNRIVVVIGTGATYSVKPYGVRDISTYHTDLFSNLKTLAVTQGDSSFPERYVYALDRAGNISVGRLELTSDTIGWTPWSGVGVTNYLSALQSTVTFCTSYTIPAATPQILVERLDNAHYLDAAVFVNSVPITLSPPAGKGPLWFWAGGSVRLIDLGTRDMGLYQVDVNGFIVPQFNAAENLASAQLVAGLPWTSTFEPFVPAMQPGTDVLQRMRKRRIAKASIYVLQSNGFTWGKRRVPPYNQGDNEEIAPPLREEAYDFRMLGRANDPRVQLIKDTPGPITILEIAMEVTA